MALVAVRVLAIKFVAVVVANVEVPKTNRLPFTVSEPSTVLVPSNALTSDAFVA